MGANEQYLYTYDLTSKKSSDKVRFVYVLKGRNGETGVVSSLSGKFLVPGCFLLPVSSGKEMREVFEKWKVKFKERRVMLMD